LNHLESEEDKHISRKRRSRRRQPNKNYGHIAKI